MATLVTQAGERNLQSAVSPQFLLRVGGLPINVVDELRFDATVQWVEALLLLERMLAERKDTLVDALHAAVSKHREDQKLRRKLINLKRDVFNLRMLDDLAATRALAASLSSPESELLNEWVDLWDRYRQARASGPAVFAQELCEKRSLLKQIIDTPDFRKGILLSSPVLDQEINSYLSSDNLRLNRTQRTAERSLVEYLLRTACKTSPFSTFTSVCPGTFDTLEADSAAGISYQMEDMAKKSFIRLNMTILSRLSSLILSSDKIRPDLPVQLTPGWRIQNNRIRYLRRMQSTEDTDEDTPVVLDIVHENVFYLPVGRLLSALLKLMGNGRKARYREIISELTDRAEYADAQEEIDTYLQHLLRLGLLIVPDLQQDIHSKYPLASYRQGLLAIGTPLTNTIAHYLGEIETLVNAYATATVARRRELFKEISWRVKTCYVELGQPDISPPRTVVYEDTTLRPRKLVVSKSAWRDILASIAEFQRLLPAFDINLPRRLITKGYFQARYGVGQRCDDFLSFAYEFRQGFFEHYLQGAGMFLNGADGERKRRINYFKQIEIEMLDDAQQAITGYMSAAYENLALGSRELKLGDEFFAAIAPYIPENSARLQSHTFFSQFAYADGEPLLVVNRIYTGLTLMFSRFAHFFSEEEGYQVVPRLRAMLEALQPPGAVFAEMKGGYDATNLNLHPQVTAYELVCPGDLSSRPRDEQIPLEDLYVQDDGQGGYLRLYSRRLGKEVIPLYLGFLLPMALPEIQQVLLNFSCATMCPVDLWSGVKTGQDEAGIAFYPRLRYKNLVLQRAQWKVRPEAFPQRESGQSDADFFLSVARWRKEHALPSKVFVAPEMSRSMPAPRAADAEPDQKMRSYKPLYVDFENYFSVSLLEASLRGSSNRMVITEMLPHRDHLWFEQNGEAYVSEFVWEMNSSEGGPDDQKLD